MRRQRTELRDQAAIGRREKAGVGELLGFVGEAHEVARYHRPGLVEMEFERGGLPGSGLGQAA